MRAPPSFFGYQIFAALVLLSSACNSRDLMTLLLHYWLASSGVPLSLCTVATAFSLEFVWCFANSMRVILLYRKCNDIKCVGYL
ncbi:hypothetical protein CY34DRAFT_86451 [Suillus luteus UH-Slu-Lm8-n1]|uniref:Secreted protein n=1 Tax=Suillus luteus UH-Slu-Lm8-n1 TaxID=930992 RepID=A0A0D0AS91_9AGAM|nr:hypothetical protein CY34DRAFT_86451 [Suillus luteus UH-Slu-Lm8-n1]